MRVDALQLLRELRQVQVEGVDDGLKRKRKKTFFPFLVSLVQTIIITTPTC
jgi:hypothetical protein